MNALTVFRYSFLVGVRDLGGLYNWKTWPSSWMIRIVGQAAFFAMLAKVLGSPDLLTFIVVGSAVVMGCAAASLAIPASTWDRDDGTYPLLVVAPSSLWPAVFGRQFVWLLNGTVSSMLALVILAFVFDISIPAGSWVPLLLLVSLPIASTYSLSLFLGCVVIRFPVVRNINNLLVAVLLAFCGVVVPLDYWPTWVEAGANLLPLTHGLEAIRMTIQGAAWGGILREAAFEACVGMAWGLISVLMIDRMANGGRTTGSIDFV